MNKRPDVYSTLLMILAITGSITGCGAFLYCRYQADKQAEETSTYRIAYIIGRYDHQRGDFGRMELLWAYHDEDCLEILGKSAIAHDKAIPNDTRIKNAAAEISIKELAIEQAERISAKPRREKHKYIRIFTDGYDAGWSSIENSSIENSSIERECADSLKSV